MSTSEVSINNLESDAELPTLRFQRPPPPPPTQSEPSSPTDIITIPSETEITPAWTETLEESIKDINDTCPLLLFEFNSLFDKFDYGTIRNRILTREMTTSPFTTVLWRIFLHCLPRDSSHWDQTIDASREQYSELADAYPLDSRKIRELNGDTEDPNHPLSQEEKSLWNQYYIHQGLRENIDQDVRRTCQDIEFFQQKHILDLLLNVLYIHSRHYEQTLPYRQGMHEILAVIVYSIHMESVVINEYPESNELMKKLYDPEYLAHDAYAIYEKIMQHLQQYYDFKPSVLQRKNDKMSEFFRRQSTGTSYVNDTVKRVNEIYQRLKDHDEPLYRRLEDLSIESTVYGIRWLRLLFGREIPFESIPTLWTVIFCYDEIFGFVDYFFLALLNKIGQLFDKYGVSEYSLCLQYLMQPNVIPDVESIIRKALSFQRTDQSRSGSNFHTQSLNDHTILIEKQKPLTPYQNSSQNPLIDLMKANSAASFVLSPKDKEMDISPEKESRQRLNENMQVQRSCASFITQLIDRMRRSIRCLHNPNEDEIKLQLDGLEQIANILEGKLPFDEKILQDLLNAYCKNKSINNDISDTI